MAMFVIEFRKSQNVGRKYFVLFYFFFASTSFRTHFLIFFIGKWKGKELKAKSEYFRRHFTNPKDSCLSVVIIKTQRQAVAVDDDDNEIRSYQHLPTTPPLTVRNCFLSSLRLDSITKHKYQQFKLLSAKMLVVS